MSNAVDASPPGYLRLAEAAELTGIPERTLRWFCQQRAFPYYKPSKKLILIPRDEFEAWWAEKRVEAETW